jgi:hypothetical protein
MKKGNIILLVICLIAIITGVAIYIEASAFQKTAKVTEGIVASSSSSVFYVTYTSDDGGQRTHKGYQPKNGKHHVGEKFRVFYQVANPEISRITDGRKTGKTILIVALVLLLLDLYLINNNRKQIKIAESFKTTGRKVDAEITGIETDMNITIREVHPYLINCRWVDPMTGKEYTHTIKYIWKDPALLLEGRNTIDVYLDREDPEKFFIDTEFLGELAR